MYKVYVLSVSGFCAIFISLSKERFFSLGKSDRFAEESQLHESSAILLNDVWLPQVELLLHYFHNNPFPLPLDQNTRKAKKSA